MKARSKAARKVAPTGKYTLDKAVFRTWQGLVIRPESTAWMKLESEDCVARRVFGCVMRDKTGRLVVPASKAVLEFSIPVPSVVKLEPVAKAAPVKAATVKVQTVAKYPKAAKPSSPRRIQYGRSVPGKMSCVVLKRHNEIALPHWNGGFWSAQLGFVERK